MIEEQQEEILSSCYYYSEDNDMGAIIPICGYYDIYGDVKCNNCPYYTLRKVSNNKIKWYIEDWD